jgi:hypothetical protein
MKTSLLLIIGWLATCSTLQAQGTITVCPDGSCDFTQLQPAIDSIPSGGAREILVSAGTYVGGGITFGGITVTIKGLDGAEATILTQTGSQRIMRISAGNVVDLVNLTIRDGFANTINDEGGGIRVASGATLNMNDCVIRENESVGDGAGVWVADGGFSSFADCQFIDNEITGPDGSGGGLYLGWIDGSTIDRCGFHRNIATRDGGGLYQARGNQSTSFTTEFCQLRNSVFWDNFAGGIGGGAVVQPALADCSIPRVIGYVTNCTFFRNSGEYGGGIYGHSSEWCGSMSSASGLTIQVFNSIFRQNGAQSIQSNQPNYRVCSIDTLTSAEADAIDCSNLNPQLLGDTQDIETDPPDTLDARIIPESFMIERGASIYLGIVIDPGLYDYNGSDRLYDDPNTDNFGSSLLDVGATEYNLDVLYELDKVLGIGLSIWTNGTGNNLFSDTGNWFGGLLPNADRGWIINEETITVELPDSSGKSGAAVLGSLTSFRGDLNLVSPTGGTALLQVPQNETLPFESGIYLGLIYPSMLTLDESMTIECDLLQNNRARIRMNGGVISVDDSVILESDQSDDPGPEGLRISTLHGPGSIQRTGSSSEKKDFDPVLVNNGRVRVDDLIQIDGDYEQISGTLKFQSRAGDDISTIDRRLEIEGMAKLGGTIVFDIGPAAWEPEIGSCFPLLTASEGFEADYNSFDFVVTRWASDIQNRFFVTTNDPCEKGLQGSGSSETVYGVVVSLDALQSQNETLQSIGVTLRDLLMFDVDGDGYEDMVLSIDTGNSNGQVVVLLNKGVNGTNDWQGFEPFGSVTGVVVGQGPRGLDAGYFSNGSTLGGKRDIVVANQSGTVTLIRNLSFPGGSDFSILQTIDLLNGEPSSSGVNPQPVSVCAMNFDEDACGLTDLAISCLDNSIWTFQNTLNCGAGFQQVGGDPLENSNREEDATEEPVTKFVPGLGSGGGKRNDKTTATGASKDGGEVDSGSKDSAFSGVGFTLVFTPHAVLAGADVVDIAEGDIDLDGDLDIVVANRADDSFGILLATGVETYASAIIIELDQGFVETDSITLADLDGDLDLDIALVCKNEASGLRVGRVIRNTFVEQGTLGWVFDAQELLVGQEPYLLRSSDVDGDGIDELLALTEATNFNGFGTGGFGFGTVSIGGGLQSCLGDVDGDGFVGGSDLAQILGSWGFCTGSCVADLDDSGTIDGTDLAILLGAWGACNPSLD